MCHEHSHRNKVGQQFFLIFQRPFCRGEGESSEKCWPILVTNASKWFVCGGNQILFCINFSWSWLPFESMPCNYKRMWPVPCFHLENDAWKFSWKMDWGGGRGGDLNNQVYINFSRFSHFHHQTNSDQKSTIGFFLNIIRRQGSCIILLSQSFKKNRLNNN